MATLDIAQVRSNFPALADGYIFADNAGGSQCLKGTVDRISDYLLRTNVQLGADYAVSVQSTQRVADGSVEVAKLMNAASPDEIAFGSSSTMLVENLARGMEPDIKSGDEFIITGEHEANGGPWKKLADRKGVTVKYWHVTPDPSDGAPENPYRVSHKITDLLPLITSKTRVVAFSACSNLLGTIVPVKEVVKAVRETAKEKGATKVEVSVDCVAYAPHRRMDVRDWDVDYCVFSFYKVYSSHQSVLYTRAEALKTSITSIAHHFLKVDTKPYKLQPGGPGYELVYGTTAVMPYLLGLTSKNDLAASFEAIAKQEHALVEPLLAFLRGQYERGVRIVGDEQAGASRVPTVSFVVVGQHAMKSKDVVKVFDEKTGIGIRYGHFYAFTLVDVLQPKLDVDDGVVRISLVHYNTVEEVQQIIELLKKALAV